MFRRYTNLSSTIKLLSTKKITLLNPATWDDKNDAYFMAEFKRRKNLKTLLALCFADCGETYHHWRVFSAGSDGVCIEFDRDSLLKAFKNDKNLIQKSVSYKKITDLKRGSKLKLDELPFTKRYPYQDEREYRIVYTDTREPVEFKDYGLDLRCVTRVTLSPWIAKSLSDPVKKLLKSIDGCNKVEIVRSTLIDNETWKNVASRM